MSTHPPLSPEIRALLDEERPLPPLPGAQRARAMARARAALAAGGVTARSPSSPRAPTRWAVAAAAALVASAAVGAAAYELRVRLGRAHAVAPAAAAVGTRSPAALLRPTAVAVDERPEAVVPAPSAPSLSPSETARAELRLLRQARDAVARGDFAAALLPLAEHARRFKNGRLAEEREALRVKSLAGLGRTEEARHAADAFRARFPRSILLPAVSQMPASAR